ncbi:retropepsin-like aspartic protease [Sphingomonas oligophenolica]|nr:retropepsin-like aspartic protease [Sphingomonas oligophenolica]
MGLALVAAPTPAVAACQIGKYLELPVTMVGKQPIVTIQINGRDARFMLDSGAFFSTIAKANALEYGLKISDLSGARLQGIGGDTSLGVATAKEVRIDGNAISHVEFAVGGSDTGFAGLLGQNILGLADVEYDLPHGIVRIMKGTDCKGASMAYWAGTKPFTIVPLQSMSDTQRHTIGTVLIDGKKIETVFDTGAMTSLLTLSAARRLGVKPNDPGVVGEGFAYGLGQGQSQAWRARFKSIDIGGEAIRNPWIAFADQQVGDADLLVGIDFFLTHHIYVDNRNHRMFVTYEGGPLFGLTPTGAIDHTGKRLDLTDKAAAPTDAAGYSRRGALLAAHDKFAEALADLDKAVAMAPTVSDFVYQRALAHLGNAQPLLATQDLDKALALEPTNARARITRAQMQLGADDPTGALVDLKAADAALAPSSDARLGLAGLYDTAEVPDAALASYDSWLKTHPEDHDRASAFNGRCWARAKLNRDLDQALADCDAAIRLRPGTAAYLDSRALVRLRRGELARALADYNAALAIEPGNAWSRYVRSIAARRAGNVAQADADKAAALAIDPRVADRAKRYGLGS